MTKLSGWREACAVFAVCAATTIAAPAQMFTTLHVFRGADGSSPQSRLIQATNGHLYGTTFLGGTCFDVDGCGTIFEIAPNGKFSSLYDFCTQGYVHCTEGSGPISLLQALNGNFYGVTDKGGANNSCNDFLGCGTVFEITPEDKLTNLYNFCSLPNCTDGFIPQPMVQAINGNFYGTTFSGGANDGTVFEISTAGELTTIYTFCLEYSCQDGSGPLGGLIQANNGSLYGTTQAGGAHIFGTVYEIAPAGKQTTLYSFCSQGYPTCADGAGPMGLSQGSNGNFYGTTLFGGASTDPCGHECGLCGHYGGCGTIFDVTPKGELTTLYTFCSQPNCADGAFPQAGLVQGTDGNFYGTTTFGGNAASSQCGSDFPGCGTVFRITPAGKLTTLYNFCSQPNCTDGFEPLAALLQATDGSFYGTTMGSYHGDCSRGYGCGTVFRLSTGLGPFVAFMRGAARVGQPIGILGQRLAGTTSVSLNGTLANFQVVSDTLIRATVPAGATTGYVTVTTPNGTLTSNVPFHVIP